MTLGRYVSLLLLGVIALPILACGGSSETPSLGDTTAVTSVAADELSRLCPEGAIAFIRLNNMARIDEQVSVIMKAAGFSPGERGSELPSAGLGEMLGNPKMDGVDLERPIGIALFVGPGGPAPVFLLPLDSKDAFQKALESSPSWEFMKDAIGLAYVGDWAAWAMDPSMVEGLSLRDTPIDIAKESLAGDVCMSLDLGAVYELAKPQLDQLTDEDMMPPNDMFPGMEGMMSGMVEGMKSFLADSKSLLVSATLADGWVAMGVRYDAKPGTGVAEFLADSTPMKPTLLRKIGAGGFMSLQANFSGDKLWEMFGPLYEVMYAEMAPDLIPLMEKSFKASDGMAMQIGLADGLAMDAVSHLTDPAGYSELTKEMIPLMEEAFAGMMPPGMNELPISFETVEGWEHSGVMIQGFRMNMNFGEMAEMPPEVQQFMDGFLGGNGIEIYNAVVGDFAVTAMGPGGKQRVEDLVDRVKGGEDVEFSPVFDRAIEGFPEKTNGIVYMNFADMAKLIANMGMPGINDRAKALLESPPSDLWMSAYWASEGSSMKFGMKMSLADLIEYVRSLSD